MDNKIDDTIVVRYTYDHYFFTGKGSIGKIIKMYKDGSIMVSFSKFTAHQPSSCFDYFIYPKDYINTENLPLIKILYCTIE